MSDQIRGKQNLNLTPTPTPDNEDLGRGLTGLSSAWPLYVGEDAQPENRDHESPKAAAG